MNLGWQDIVVAVIALLAIVFLYRHFRPRRRKVVAVIPAAEVRVRKPRPPAAGTEPK